MASFRAGRLRRLLRPPGGDQPEASTSEAMTLEVLLLDYEMARDDERSVLNVQTGLYGVAIALIALMVGALTQECGFGMKPAPDCTNVPDAILAAAPLLPLGLIAFIQSIGSISTLRSYYMRGLEAELGRFAAEPMTTLGDLRPISYVGMTIELASARRGGLANRILINVILLAILVVFGGMTFYIGLVVARPFQGAMIILYGTVILVLAHQTIAATLGGPALFESVAERFVRGTRYAGMPHAEAADSPADSPADSHADPPADSLAVEKRSSAARPRSLSSYLALPRPEDLIKWTIAPLTYVVYAWAVGEWGDWQRVLVLWLILEYLVYMARYQWNDIRGAADDWAHSESSARGRLPQGRDPGESRSHIRASGFIAVLRLVLAILVAWSAGVVPSAAWIIVAVFGVAIPYEMLRNRKAAVLPIWLLVGLGYAIRAAVGISGAGVPLLSRPALAGLAFFITFGIMFVLLTWVADATSYGWVQNGIWMFREALREKPHLAGLLPFTSAGPPVISHVPEPLPAEERGGNQRILITDPRRPRLHAPWNVAQLFAATAGALLGLELAAPADRRPLIYLMTLGCGVLLAVLLQQIRTGWINLLTVVAGGAALVVVALFAESALPAVTPVPWLVAALTFVSFRRSSYQDLKSFRGKVMGLVRTLRGWVTERLVGRTTWENIVRPGASGR